MTNTPKGSITWNLCRRGLEFFTQHLYRIPGNGINTFLWDDKIKVNVPLNSDLSFTEIKLWLVNNGLLRFSDIISWDNNGNWVAWDYLKLGERAHPSLSSKHILLMEKLYGLAPIHISCKDVWG